VNYFDGKRDENANIGFDECGFASRSILYSEWPHIVQSDTVKYGIRSDAFNG
jgi:hypothetical protein